MSKEQSKCPNCDSLQAPDNIKYLGDQKYECPNCKTQELERLYGEIERKVDGDTMSMIYKLADLELELEKQSNQ
jgi:transposase-like protein